MAGGRITEANDISSPRFQAEHGIETCNAMCITVGNIQVISADLYIVLAEIMLGIVILEIMENIQDIIESRFKFF